MVVARYGEALAPEDSKLLGESTTMPCSALTERMSSWDQHDTSKRGIPSERLIRLYELWGKGGWGIAVTGNGMVHPEHLEAAGNAIIYAPHQTPERINQFRRIANAAKAHGSPAVMQISHAGRQVPVFVNPHPVGAGDAQLGCREAKYAFIMGQYYGKPTPLTKEGIKETVDQFAYAAQIAYETGFDGVQMHGAHGYLIAQFLSAVTNNRTDEYGGSAHNRARFIREIVTAIRAKVPDPSFMVGIKLNSTEFQAVGIKPTEATELCKELEAMELDFVELSGGNYEKWIAFDQGYIPRESTKRRESFFTEVTFSELIVPHLSKIVPYVTGGFRSAAGMADAVRSGSCAGIGLGRPATSDPYLPEEVISGKATGATINRPPQGDFWIQGAASGSQEESIARGVPIFDLSDPKVVQGFTETAYAFREQSTADNENGVVKAGFVVVENPGVYQEIQA